MSHKKKIEADNITDECRSYCELLDKGVRFVNMTKLLEKDTDEAIKESQNRPVFITDFHEQSHWNDLLQSMNIKLCKMWATK